MEMGSRWVNIYLPHTGFRQGSGESGSAPEGAPSGCRGENGLQGTEKQDAPQGRPLPWSMLERWGFGQGWASGWI